MNISRILLVSVIVMFFITLTVQAFTIYQANKEVGSRMEYHTKWLAIPEDIRPADSLNSYMGNWSEAARINPLLPLSVFCLLIGLVGYLYYYDWRYEPQLEMFGRYGGYYEL